MATAGKLDPQAIKNILGVLRQGRDITTAARIAGVSRQAIYAKMKASPAFRDQIDEAKAFALDCVVGALWDAATGQPVAPRNRPANIIAAIYYTKNKDPQNWRDKHDIEHSGGLTLAQIVAKAEAEDEDASQKKTD